MSYPKTLSLFEQHRADFEAWLLNKGCVLIPLTNDFEILRVMHALGISMVYKKLGGTLTWNKPAGLLWDIFEGAPDDHGLIPKPGESSYITERGPILEKRRRERERRRGLVVGDESLESLMEMFDSTKIRCTRSRILDGREPYEAHVNNWEYGHSEVGYGDTPIGALRAAVRRYKLEYPEDGGGGSMKTYTEEEIQVLLKRAGDHDWRNDALKDRGQQIRILNGQVWALQHQLKEARETPSAWEWTAGKWRYDCGFAQKGWQERGKEIEGLKSEISDLRARLDALLGQRGDYASVFRMMLDPGSGYCLRPICGLWNVGQE